MECYCPAEGMRNVGRQRPERHNPQEDEKHAHPQTQRGREPISCPRLWTIHCPCKFPTPLSWPQTRARLRYELSRCDVCRSVQPSQPLALIAPNPGAADARRAVGPVGSATVSAVVSPGLPGRPACLLHRLHFLHRWAIRTLRVQRRHRDVGIGSSLPEPVSRSFPRIQTAWTYSIRLQQRPLPTPNTPYHAQPISSAFGGASPSYSARSTYSASHDLGSTSS